MGIDCVYVRKNGSIDGTSIVEGDANDLLGVFNVSRFTGLGEVWWG